MTEERSIDASDTRGIDAARERAIDAAEDRALRAVAEAENQAKRLTRELEDRVRYANQSLLRELLPVFDNIRLCAVNASGGAETGALAEALENTVEEFLETLERVGVEMVSAAPGDPFDPSTQEAVLHEDDPRHVGQVVTKVLQPGFRYHDRLLRPAKVAVSRGAQ